MMTFLSRCSTTLTITTLFLLKLLLSPPTISATTDTPVHNVSDTPVLDMDRNPLDFTSQYYIILATLSRFPSGLRLQLRPESQTLLSCPEFVYRTPLEHDFGLPVKFLCTNPFEINITLLTELQISFVSTHLYCPPIWSLTTDPETARLYVLTGVYVNRNCKVKQGTKLNALFKIVPTNKTRPYEYMIVVSPDQFPPDVGILGFFHEEPTNKTRPYEYTIPNSPDKPPYDVGILALFHEDDTDWLSLSFKNQPEPLPLYFKKHD